MFDRCRGSIFPDVELLMVDDDFVLASNEFGLAMERRGIERKIAFSNHQQANFVEREVQTLKQVIRTTLHGLSKKLWPRIIFDVANHLNAMPRPARRTQLAAPPLSWRCSK